MCVRVCYVRVRFILHPDVTGADFMSMMSRVKGYDGRRRDEGRDKVTVDDPSCVNSIC